ncbi:MAG: hypothetical protein ABWX83_04060 [Luteibacter sp.]
MAESAQGPRKACSSRSAFAVFDDRVPMAQAIQLCGYQHAVGGIVFGDEDVECHRRRTDDVRCRGESRRCIGLFHDEFQLDVECLCTPGSARQARLRRRGGNQPRCLAPSCPSRGTKEGSAVGSMPIRRMGGPASHARCFGLTRMGASAFACRGVSLRGAASGSSPCEATDDASASPVLAETIAIAARCDGTRDFDDGERADGIAKADVIMGTVVAHSMKKILNRFMVFLRPLTNESCNLHEVRRVAHLMENSCTDPLMR